MLELALAALPVRSIRSSLLALATEFSGDSSTGISVSVTSEMTAEAVPSLPSRV